MKKINLKKLKSDLDKYNLDDTHKEMIISQVTLFNDTLKLYNEGNVKATYILYQLSLAISKQMAALKKQNPGNDEDEFNSFITKHKK